MFTRPHQPTRRGAAAALLLSISLLTGCTQDQPLVREGGYGGTDAPTSATAGPDAPATSPSDTSTPGTGASSATSADAPSDGSPSSDTITVPTGLPAPGSNWKPPAVTESDLDFYRNMTAKGYVLELRDPKTFPAKRSDLSQPQLDPDALTNSELGAISTAHFYFTGVNYYINTGDSAPMDSVTDPNCINCSKIKTSYDPFFTRGGYAIARDVSIKEMLITGHTGNTFTLTGEIIFPQTVTLVPELSTYLVSPDVSGTCAVTVSWSAEGWFKVTNFEISAKP